MVSEVAQKAMNTIMENDDVLHHPHVLQFVATEVVESTVRAWKAMPEAYPLSHQVGMGEDEFRLHTAILTCSMFFVAGALFGKENLEKLSPCDCMLVDDDALEELLKEKPKDA
jgi:hypothetical protein